MVSYVGGIRVRVSDIFCREKAGLQAGCTHAHDEKKKHVSGADRGRWVGGGRLGANALRDVRTAFACADVGKQGQDSYRTVAQDNERGPSMRCDVMKTRREAFARGGTAVSLFSRKLEGPLKFGTLLS